MKRLALGLLTAAGWSGSAAGQTPTVWSSPPQRISPIVAPGSLTAAPPAPLSAPIAAPPAPVCVPAAAVAAESGSDVWVSAELLLWWLKGSPTPSLASASPAGTPRAQAGVLGTPGATNLFGNSNLDDNLRAGFRVRAGFWLDDGRTTGVDVGYFHLGNRGTRSVNGAADGRSIVSRPFIEAATGLPASELVSFPGVLGGTVTVASSSRFQGGEANLTCNLSPCDPCRQMRFYTGYRVLNLNESLTITENLTNLDPTTGVPVGTSIVVRDHFRAENTFHGWQAGLAGQVYRDRFVLGYRVGAGLGVLNRRTDIYGATFVTPPGGPQTIRAGGLLAQPTNIGSQSDSVFSVTADATLSIGYRLTDTLRVSVGYSYLYLSNVVRPGDLIDTTVDSRQLRGPTPDATRPARQNRDGDFWAQGVNFAAILDF